MFQSQILGHDEDFLSVLVGPQDLGTLSDDQNTKVGVEQTKKIVRVANYIAGLEENE